MNKRFHSTIYHELISIRSNQGGFKGGFKSLDERMKNAREVIGMVKFAAKKSGSGFVVERDGIH